MEALITIKVFDPAWLELSKEDITYRKQIKEPDDIEIEKYKEAVSFKFHFDVLEYTINRNTNYSFALDKGKRITIGNVTMIEFAGETETEKVIVSNELIFGDFEAKKSGGKLYCYIYLDGRLEYRMIKENIWLSGNHL